jgi:membrane AbrB-like protein
VAGLGGYAFHRLGLPAAWLSGSVFAAVFWNVAGLGRPLSRPLADAAMLLSGASMGAGVTPEALAAVGRYPVSLLLLTVCVVAATAASVEWLRRMCGWRRDDALLACAPGAFSTVLSIALDRNAATAEIAVVQSLRIFVLVALLPSTVALIGGGGPGFLGGGRPIASPTVLGLILFGGLAVGALLRRLRVAAPVLLGATVASTFVHATGWTPGIVPPPVATLGLVLIGAFVAERFRNLDREALKRTIPAAAGSFLLSMALAGLAAAAAAWLAGVPMAEALVAFAPGGLEAMMVLALVLGLDPLYVGVHHLARFLGIALVLPFVFTWLRARDERTRQPTRAEATDADPLPGGPDQGGV